MADSWQVFFVALLTAAATGLGAIPIFFIKTTEVRWQGIASAAAGGMMLSATGEMRVRRACWCRCFSRCWR